MFNLRPHTHLLYGFCCLLTVFAHAENNTDLQNKSNEVPKPITSKEDPLPAGERAWISVGNDAARSINKKFAPLLKKRKISVVKSAVEDVSLVHIPVAKLHELSEFMHAEYNRCAGFMFHDSFDQAQAYLKASQQKQLNTKAINYTIDNPAGVESLLAQLSQNNLTDTINTLSGFHNRYYQQQTGVDAANWIKTKWQTLSASRGDISVDLFDHNWPQPSVIATITGTEQANEVLVIGGHLDSINLWRPDYGRAPGSDDNASGIAVITETLRAIVESGFKPKRTIKLMGYAAEEVGLRGSQEIAEAYKNEGIDVIGMVQFDMTAYHGTANADIVFMTDYTNNAQNQFLAQLLDTYHQDIIYDWGQCGYACSDHASWHNQGYAASMPFESHSGEHNPNIHTADDDSFDVTHAIKFAKLSATLVAELAKGSTGVAPSPTATPTPTASPSPTVMPSPSPIPDEELENGVARQNLNAPGGDDLTFYLEVPDEAVDLEFSISGGSGDADLYVSHATPPTDNAYGCRPFEYGNNETCSFPNPEPGIYYVRLKAYESFSGVTLVANYEVDDTPGEVDPIHISFEDIDISWLQWERLTQPLASGYTTLKVSVNGGSGNRTLYLQHNNKPTFFNFDCRSNAGTTEESCTVDLPEAGTWHIGVFGNRNVSRMMLTIEAY